MASKLKVLIVDDDPGIRALIQRYLDAIEGVPFELDWVGTAEEALDRLIHGDYDVYLVDYRLGASDGLELVGTAVCEGSDAAIIMLTAHGSRELELKAMEAGAEFFLEKERMDPVLLERAIRMVLDRHRLRRSLAERARELQAANDELRLAEQKLQERTRELERSNDELQQFAYVASHDLQEPLRMIAGYTGLLERRLGERLDENTRLFMGYVVEGVQRMHRLIDDLLSYSRAGSRPAEPTVTSGRSALDRALENLRSSIEETGGTIRCDDLPSVLIDEGKLTQVFQNLVGNALKFRNSRSPVVEIDALDDGDYWRFCVRDNGIGLPEKHRERIFVIFQRLHGRDEYPGTGIGLSICKRIVEHHGGRIWVESQESQPGQGAAFNFTLPKAKVGEEPAEA